jgi:outer membrane protein W
MKTKTLLALALSLSFASVYAQSEEQVLNSAPIDVDGYLHEKPVTDGELEQIKSEIRKQKNDITLGKEKTKGFRELTKTTEKLSEVTEEYIDEKKSAKKDIEEYNKKIKCLMEENPGKDCEKYVRNRNRDENQSGQVAQEVTVGQAAPVAVTSTAEASALTGRAFEEMKVLPYFGATQYNGKVEQLESEISAGLRLESNINSRFTMGVGFNYASLKTDDFANNLFSGYSGYYGAYGAKGREIQYKTMGLDLYGKFFITGGERFRPYLGAALGYNRASLKYSQNNPYSSFTGGSFFNYGGEELKNSFATGTLMAGTQIMITRSFGLNIEGAYSTALGNSFSSQSTKNPFNSPDQRRLRQLGEEIINANAISLLAGVVVVF